MPRLTVLVIVEVFAPFDQVVHFILKLIILEIIEFIVIERVVIE